jgi:PAS domain-containing protein
VLLDGGELMAAGQGSRGPTVRSKWMRLALETYVTLPLSTALLLGAIWAFTFHFIDIERQAARAGAADSVQELADTYEAQVARNLGAIEQTLRVIAYAAERKGAAGALAELNGHGLLPSGLMFSVSITDALGRTVARNPAARALSVATQPYFRVHRDTPGQEVRVGETQADDAAGDARLHFTRRLNDADGQFAGVVIIEVDPGYFTAGYERRRQGEQGVLALVGNDGVVRALRTGDRISWGEQIDLRTEIGAPTTHSWDGVKRYATARQLQGFPLLALAGLAEREQMAQFEQRRRNSLMEAGVASAVLVVLAAMAWYWAWQGARARRRIRRANETYAAASEANMDAFFVLRGVRDRKGAVTDFRIMTTNRRAEKLTGLSRQQLQSMTVSEWLPQARHNGIFAELERIMCKGGIYEEAALAGGGGGRRRGGDRARHQRAQAGGRAHRAHGAP